MPPSQAGLGGAGGSRTHVRTRKPYAFYTLIPDFVFVLRQDPDHQPQPYSQELHHDNETLPGLFPMLLHRLARRIRNNIHGAMSRSLALQGN